MSALNTRSLVFLFCIITSAIAAPWWRRHVKKEMGQVVRTMTYNRKANEKAALSVLTLHGQSMEWYRLDDGVMGGQSETLLKEHEGAMHFEGTVNTQGGGFCSVRSKLAEGSLSRAKGVKVLLTGDGKTYKFTLSDGHPSTGGPFGGSPNWQIDIPTKKGIEEEVLIYFQNLKPAFGGRAKSTPEDLSKYKFDSSLMREIGFMLSLRLSDGSPNPKETFGEGIFPFSLKILSIKTVIE